MTKYKFRKIGVLGYESDNSWTPTMVRALLAMDKEKGRFIVTQYKIGQIAKTYGVHPNSVLGWKQNFLEKGYEIFARDGTIAEYEQHIAKLEQLLGKKEVEIALLKNFLGRMP